MPVSQVENAPSAIKNINVCFGFPVERGRVAFPYAGGIRRVDDRVPAHPYIGVQQEQPEHDSSYRTAKR